MQNYFYERDELSPKIYAYSDTSFPGMLKIGYTTRSVETRIKEQYPIVRPGEKTYTIEIDTPAVKLSGETFTDKEVHKVLNGLNRKIEGEWYRCTKEEVIAAIAAVKEERTLDLQRTRNFLPRPEQQEAVSKAKEYFTNQLRDSSRSPHFLWNCKMRFGKTFATYKLATEMNWSKMLVLTFKPAVKHAWKEDLLTHVDFKDWKFVTKEDQEVIDQDSDRFVCFGSLQDFLGKTKLGGVKSLNEWVHNIEWDCVIFDEYHFGAWRDNTKEMFVSSSERAKDVTSETGTIDIDLMSNELPIKSSTFLYLSGTPFKVLHSGEFIEEQIFSWTYSDEQKAKVDWSGDGNPYISLPRMVMMTYEMPDSVKSVLQNSGIDYFDLNEFFKATGEGEEATFIFEKEVQMWLNFIRGSDIASMFDSIRSKDGIPLPFGSTKLLSAITHSFWFLPNVASCFAMRNLLLGNHNKFFHDYKVVVAAGPAAGLGDEALKPVLKAMENPLKTKSITLSCMKLTTGVTVPPWSAVFMLRSIKSPETYFQTAFRCQSPWQLTNPSGTDPNEAVNLKPICYVFDFDPNRALQQIADYSCKLSSDSLNPEQQVDQFIEFLPVLAFDGQLMREVNAAGVLDIALSGTTATLLARRWESAALVNVDDITLSKILANEEAMKVLGNIEAFRGLNADLTTIISKNEELRAKKSNRNDENDKSLKKEISEDEKEIRNKRVEIRDKLIKFATRIPIFMYLTDFRENILQDVIRKLEPQLFQKVTGLTLAEFELLVSLNVFNTKLMDDAIYKFKRYEDASLRYAGVEKHDFKNIGLWSKTVTDQSSNI